MSEQKWSPEDWAWEQIRAGKTADFNDHFGETLDPKDPAGWEDSRRIDAGFLRKVFFEKPYRDEIPIEGVRIVGALLPDGLVLESGRLKQNVLFDQCRIRAPIRLVDVTIEGGFPCKRHGWGEPPTLLPSH